MAPMPSKTTHDGSGTALMPALGLMPKFASTMLKSLMSTVPSPLKSPCHQVAAVLSKLASTIVRSLMSTLPSPLASPGLRGSQEEAIALPGRVITSANNLPGIVDGTCFFQCPTGGNQRVQVNHRPIAVTRGDFDPRHVVSHYKISV